MLKELSLFTGAGGGLLGTKLLGWQHIGYVENENYCQKVLHQRIADGILDAAPIFGDIQEFIREGYAEAYKGMVDVITAGFPCQPFSVAGCGLAEKDERNMWPETIECLRIIRPPYAFLENVPNVFNHKYIQRIFGDLAESGYCVRYRPLSAADVGAIHPRKRQWFLAADYSRVGCNRGSFKGQGIQGYQTCNENKSGITNSNCFSERDKGMCEKKVSRKQGLSGWEGIRSLSDLRGRPDIPQPLICRMDVRTSRGVDRIRAIGNMQVPKVVATAWKLLNK